MKTLILTFMLTSIITAQTKFPELNELIQSGEYSKAERMIEEKILSGELNPQEYLALKFEKERMNRIRKDFNKTSADILQVVNKYYPDANENDLEKWEKDGSLEYKIIDGTKWYFARSAYNLFRINKDAKKQKELVDGYQKDGLDVFLEQYIPKVLDESANSYEKFIKPVVLNLNYTVTVKPDAVPAGEIIRCWLPYPREGHQRQQDVRLFGVNSNEYVIADNNNPQRTLYVEKTAQSGEPTVFNMVLEVAMFSE
ncbi:MAG: transglutaminase domain-containing protein, partial [Ignavibacteriaceae bacterium]